MTTVSYTLVDVYLLRPVASGVEVLLLRRAAGGRCPGSWEGVHGHVEPGEVPAAAADREVLEETGLVAERLYNLSRVEGFYLHHRDEVAMVPVFVAWVRPGVEVCLSPEHDAFEWLPAALAAERFSWPRSRRAIADALELVGNGSAGPLEDVLRVR
ncbi:MAG: NUDIX domain-containing protein [Gemmatimonadota bacterium]|nr:NUDIX domain-containing protein [Gemmatimonadota bacterium]